MARRSELPRGKRALLIGLAGAVGYGVASWITNIFPIPVADNVDVRLGVAIPIFLGLIYGPWVGFLTGAVGNLVGDLLSGYIQFPPDAPSGVWALDFLRGFVVHWQIGNGIMGLVPGLLALRYARYFSFKDQLVAAAFTVVGVVGGMALASFTGMALDGTDFEYAYTRVFLPVTQVNLISALVIVPVLLFNHARLDVRAVVWKDFVVLRRLTFTILISAALPIVLLGLLLAQVAPGGPGTTAEITAKLVITIVLTLAFTVVNAALMAQGISRPLLRLTDVVRRLETGELTSTEADELKQTAGGDEFSRLYQALGGMAQEVIRREERLRDQVAELQGEVDRLKGA